MHFYNSYDEHYQIYIILDTTNKNFPGDSQCCEWLVRGIVGAIDTVVKVIILVLNDIDVVTAILCMSEH